MAKHVKRDYESDTLIVHWDSAKCVHCGNCARGLPEVFRPRESPWVNMAGAEPEAIVKQVEQCPSGALLLTRK